MDNQDFNPETNCNCLWKPNQDSFLSSEHFQDNFTLKLPILLSETTLRLFCTSPISNEPLFQAFPCLVIYLKLIKDTLKSVKFSAQLCINFESFNVQFLKNILFMLIFTHMFLNSQKGSQYYFYPSEKLNICDINFSQFIFIKFHNISTFPSMNHL